MNMNTVVGELNNLAVGSIERRDLRNALDLLRDALKCTVETFTSSEEYLEFKQKMLSHFAAPVQSNSSFAGCPNNSSSVHSENTFQTTGGNCSEQQRLPLRNSTAFVHAHGINLTSRFGKDFASNPASNHIISAIIIFNLALVYHLKALEDESSSVIRLRKAHSLYLRSASLLNDAGVSFGSSTGYDILDILLLALQNNLAEVNFELLEYRQARSFFDQLIKFAATIDPNVYGDVSISSSMEQLKSGLLLNAIILRTPTLASAA